MAVYMKVFIFNNTGKIILTTGGVKKWYPVVSVLRYYTDIRLNNLGKITKPLSQDII
jgi:hypothetical protein